MVIHQIVIIGAGPAGISAAVEALNKGFSPEDILILEKSGEIAHMIASKYPDEKAVLANYKNKVADDIGGLQIEDMTKKEFMTYMNDLVHTHKIQILYHQNVEQITKLNNGQLAVQTSEGSYLANSVFMAIGTMSSPRTLGVKVTDSVANKIFYDIQAITPQMKNILVVGGGDSAAEYANILVERGHQVTLSYRKEEFTRMIEANQEITNALIKEEKIIFLPSSNLEKIEEHSHKARVFFRELKEPRDFDAIIAALGTERPANYLTSLGVKMVKEGHDIFSESSLDGVFFVGDLASGKKGGTINIAFNSGSKAIIEACSFYLDCSTTST